MRDEDFGWFVENYAKLYEEYGVSYLVIRGKKVIGAYQTPKEAIDETTKSFSMGDFIVQFCNGEESGYTNYIASAQISVL